AGSVTIEFGKTISYGLHTWTKQTPSGGGPVSIYVAGMLANTAYHMRADIKYGDGTTFTDTDHTFTTGSYAANLLPKVTATTTQGQTPQPGIEILNPVGGVSSSLIATDLSGNIIWEYNPSPALTNNAELLAPKLLPDGDFVVLIAVSSTVPLYGPIPTNVPNVVREFDLAGNTIKQITMAQLNTRLAAANYNLTLQVFSHDVTPLPNGHWLVLANTLKNVVLTGQTTPTKVLGDVIVDLDTNLNPVWVWNEFDHLDVNRQPWMFPDWTHTNAVIYSPDDGNILVSIRHQNWVVKVDYNNGAGTGNVLWRLGEGGDFKLVGGTDPTDWNYAQHGPAFTTTNTSGIFGLTLMDNGDDRMYPGGTTVTCGGTGAPACYSSVPIFQINESAMTATLKFHQILQPILYNDFGGNAQTLANGNVEYDLCGLGGTNSQIFEVTNSSNPQTVWNMKLSNNNFYRAYRLPSLYPGVQW
ncbi:MAG TPA: aryl-sulfate sulfotransferase, partial [Acidobacteriaceae bacterium]|nr:aryl-sulfate sulfotransferase [Acidobacteriaceae bacterium]